MSDEPIPGLQEKAAGHAQPFTRHQRVHATCHRGALFARKLILLLGKTWISRQWLTGCGCWEGWGCNLGGRAGGGCGGLVGWAAAPLRLVPRIPGQGCGAAGSWWRGPGGRNANTGGGRRKAAVSAAARRSQNGGVWVPLAFPPSEHWGQRWWWSWGSL